MKNFKGLISAVIMLVIMILSFTVTAYADNRQYEYGDTCHTMTNKWFGEETELFSSSSEELLIREYFAIREKSLTDNANAVTNILSKDVLDIENQRRNNLVNMQQKMRIKITDAESHVSIGNATVDNGVFTAEVREWIFYDYDDLDVAGVGLNVAGFGVEHIVKVKDGIIIADEYDESDMTGICTATKEKSEFIVLENGSSDDTILMSNFYADYDIDAVAKYANKYALDYNPDYYNFNSVGGDCANFTSQSIYAGGMPQVVGTAYGTDGWYYKTSSNRSATWTGAKQLRTWMANNRGVLINSPSASQIYKGSPVFYDWYNDGSWDHATICVGKNAEGVPVINSHNNDKYQEKWNYGYAATVYSTVQLTVSNPESGSITPVITSAKGDNHTDITVKWSKVSNATKYKVLRRKAGDSDYVTAKSSTTETSFTDTGLEKNKRYYYKVVAYNGSTELGTSDAVGAYTKFDSPTIKAESASKLSLSWDSVSYAESYTVRRRIEDGEYDDVKTVTETTFTDSGLTAGTRYYYWIQANCNVNGEEITAKSTSSSCYTLPNAPTITSIDDTSKTEITIKWDAVNSANSYRIERRKAGIGTVYETVNPSITETTYVDAGLETGQRYYYKVYAVNSSGESSASSAVGGYTKFNEPTIKPISETEISLSWDTITAAESYTIRRRIDGGEYADIATVSGTTYTDSGLIAGTRYYYWIQANCAVDGTSYVAKSLSKSGMTLTYLNVGDSFNAYITHASSGLTLTQDNDGNVVVRSNTSALNQRWWFERQNDGSYKIRSNLNNRLLDVYGGIDTDGNNVAAYDDNGGGSNQRWFVVDNGGTVLLKPASGACVLDVANGHLLPVAEGTNVQVCSNNGSSAQEFYINIIDKYALDVNGVINGEYSSHTIGFGTFDVYIDGVINEDDVSDFYLYIPIGSTYEIKDIRENEGYSYKGLAKGNLTGSVNNDVDIQIMFEANTYTVQYNANGGSGTTAISNHVYAIEKALTANGFTRSGYTFLGWSLSPSATEADYADQENVTNLTDIHGDVVTLYAVWEKDIVSVTGVTLNQSEVNIELGNTITLFASVTPYDATDKTVVWQTSDTSVATVENGVVSTKGLGTAIITVRTIDGSKTDSCVVKVSKPYVSVTGVTLNTYEETLYTGESVKLVATVIPSDATDKTIFWESSDETVATVVDGVVTAVGAGEATIKVTTDIGFFSASCTVYVEEISYDYTVNSLLGTVKDGKFYAEAEIVKNTDRNSKDMIVIAVYKDDVMVDMVYMKANFKMGQTVSFGGILDGSEGTTLKAFVWDSLTGMNALSNVIEK